MRVRLCSCACACVRVRVCVRARARFTTYTRARARTHAHTHTHTNARAHTHKHTHVHVFRTQILSVMLRVQTPFSFCFLQFFPSFFQFNLTFSPNTLHFFFSLPFFQFFYFQDSDYEQLKARAELQYLNGINVCERERERERESVCVLRR